MADTHLNVTEIELLEAVRTRLRDKLNWCTESTCFCADEAIPSVIPSAEPIVTVVLDDTGFDEALWSGGGPMQLGSQVNVLVTILTRCVLDSPPKADVRLLDDARGIIAYRNQVLAALLVSDDSCETFRSPWDPLIEDGAIQSRFLRDYGLTPARSTGPRRVQIGQNTERLMLAVQIYFKAAMDIKLPTIDQLQPL